MKIAGYLTTNEVAEKLAVSPSRVKNLVRFGRLHPIKLGKVNLYKVEEINNFTKLEIGRPAKSVTESSKSIRKR